MAMFDVVFRKGMCDFVSVGISGFRGLGIRLAFQIRRPGLSAKRPQGIALQMVLKTNPKL